MRDEDGEGEGEGEGGGGLAPGTPTAAMSEDTHESRTGWQPQDGSSRASSEPRIYAFGDEVLGQNGHVVSLALDCHPDGSRDEKSSADASQERITTMGLVDARCWLMRVELVKELGYARSEPSSQRCSQLLNWNLIRFFRHP